ncbi:MAG: hypothetical protein GY930_19020 [bacterium]|nr:hypothetical protein [bacterium]
MSNEPAQAPRPVLSSIRGLVAAAMAVTILGGIAGSLLGFAGDSHWTLDLFSHFRLQYLIGASLLFVLALLLRQWRNAGLAGAGLLLNALLIWPLYQGPTAAPANQGETLKILYANVLTHNQRYGELVQLVQQEQPDIIALLEFSEAWQEAVSMDLQAWPHREIRPRDDNFGIAVFSRFPLENSTWPVLTPTGSATLLSSLHWNGRKVPFIFAHPYPPIHRYASNTARAQVAELCLREELQHEAALLIGDLNATPWSHTYRQLQGTPLHDARHGFGILPTWPAGLPAFLRIPIDAVLVGPRWQVQELRVGPDIGSDHLPLIAELSLAQNSPSNESKATQAPR